MFLFTLLSNFLTSFPIFSPAENPPSTRLTAAGFKMSFGGELKTFCQLARVQTRVCTIFSPHALRPPGVCLLINVLLISIHEKIAFIWSEFSLKLLCLRVSCRIIQNRVLLFILGVIIVLTVILAIYFNWRGH